MKAFPSENSGVMSWNKLLPGSESQTHFVCSIYQSEPDSEIYGGNKGGYQSRVNNGSRQKRDMHACPITLAGVRDGKWGEKKKKKRQMGKKFAKYFFLPSTTERKACRKFPEQLLRRCGVTERKAGEQLAVKRAGCCTVVVVEGA